MTPWLWIAAAIAFLPAQALAQTFQSESGPLLVETVAKGLDRPWGLAFLPDGRVLVTERPGRLRIVARLCAGGPLSISRLSDGSKVTRQAVTKHLHALSHAGLVRDRRHGRESIWELEPGRLEIAHRYLDHISNEWDAAIGRLKAFVEE